MKPQTSRHDATVDVDWVFKRTFGLSQYRGDQQRIMAEGATDRDILVVAPTGLGKSVCFWVPAVAAKHGVTLVISPLISLIKEQVGKLRAKGVACGAWIGSNSREERTRMAKDLRSSHPKMRILYTTPEGLLSSQLQSLIQVLFKQHELNRLVVDEAHCISEWGHDFRPAYLKLNHFRESFPGIGITALTASATPRITADVASILALSDMYVSTHSFNRDNLYYEIKYYSERAMAMYRQQQEQIKEQANKNEVNEESGAYFDGPLTGDLLTEPLCRNKDLVKFITRMSKRMANTPSGIVYCRARSKCEEVAQFLASHGFNAASYHRGLPETLADERQRSWIEGSLDIIVATIAFGMGIDKADCRFVVHYDVPKSFEGYYQETGRAGRDGSAARCLLYFSEEDRARVESLNKGKSANSSLPALIKYIEDTRTCRHIQVCQFFGEEAHDVLRYCKQMCDVCRDKEKASRKRELGLVVLDPQSTQVVIESIDLTELDDDLDDEEDIYIKSEQGNSCLEDSEIVDGNNHGAAEGPGLTGMQLEDPRDMAENEEARMTTEGSDAMADEPQPAILSKSLTEDPHGPHCDTRPRAPLRETMPLFLPRESQESHIDIDEDFILEEDDIILEEAHEDTTTTRFNDEIVIESTSHLLISDANPGSDGLLKMLEADKELFVSEEITDRDVLLDKRYGAVEKAFETRLSSAENDALDSCDISPVVHSKPIDTNARRRAVEWLYKGLSGMCGDKVYQVPSDLPDLPRCAESDRTKEQIAPSVYFLSEGELMHDAKGMLLSHAKLYFCISSWERKRARDLLGKIKRSNRPGKWAKLARDIESDIFWSSLTYDGYRSRAVTYAILLFYFAYERATPTWEAPPDMEERLGNVSYELEHLIELLGSVL